MNKSSRKWAFFISPYKTKNDKKTDAFASAFFHNTGKITHIILT
ncbi:hypothetical protein URS_3283 [Acinetobacter ursingii]|nr:hypothetical protein URS_3283 [Acinetobacter ursingii]